ncbi:hypothetical protein DFH07DRAFT_1006611 [Mycena maculata]|uniref:Amino acid permease/ SLC12A domain-containing protein n=1 Tax=Mycena maculata TaxID=230809 RepID=A0AAD7MLP7_9AGAR|nr:hypothetical protein DFH07DRAFT_1006611 [Mycena maculata]
METPPRMEIQTIIRKFSDSAASCRCHRYRPICANWDGAPIAGPDSLLLSFILWSTVDLAINDRLSVELQQYQHAPARVLHPRGSDSRVLVPYTDPSLLVSADIRRGADTSPYDIAMVTFHLGTLAHMVNAPVMLSIFSAGNSYVYSVSHTLFGLAASRASCNARGVHVYVVSTILAACISAGVAHLSSVLK